MYGWNYENYLGQNFLTWLTAIVCSQAAAAPVRLLLCSRQGGLEQTVQVSYQLIRSQVPRTLTPGCRVGHIERPFFRKTGHFLCRTVLAPILPCRFRGQQPVTHKQGWWVGWAVTECQWLIDWKAQLIFLEKWQDCCVEIDMVFISPGINKLISEVMKLNIYLINI